MPKRGGHPRKASHHRTDADDGKGVADNGQAVEEDEENTLLTKDVYVLAKDLAVDRAQIRRLKRRRTHQTKVDGGMPTSSCESFSNQPTVVCFVDFVILLV